MEREGENEEEEVQLCFVNLPNSSIFLLAPTVLADIFVGGISIVLFWSDRGPGEVPTLKFKILASNIIIQNETIFDQFFYKSI